MHRHQLLTASGMLSLRRRLSRLSPCNWVFTADIEVDDARHEPLGYAFVRGHLNQASCGFISILRGDRDVRVVTVPLMALGRLHQDITERLVAEPQLFDSSTE